MNHNGMTPLRILAMKSTDVRGILSWFEVNRRAVFVGGRRDNSSLDYLREHTLEESGTLHFGNYAVMPTSSSSIEWNQGLNHGRGDNNDD